MLPQLTMAVEHYNRLVRMIKQGVEPVMELDLGVSFHNDDLTAANTVAENPRFRPRPGRAGGDGRRPPRLLAWRRPAPPTTRPVAPSRWKWSASFRLWR